MAKKKPDPPTAAEWQTAAGDVAVKDESEAADDPSIVDAEFETIPDGPLDPAKAYDSPEALAEYDAETVQLVQEQEIECGELESDWADRQALAKNAKATFEDARLELRRLIRERRDNRGKAPQPSLYPDPKQADGEPGTPPEDESWKAVPLSSLPLQKRVLDALAAPVHKDRGNLAPILTLGDLTKYQDPEASGWVKKLVDIRGIGEGAAEAIGAACEAFWEERGKAK